MNKIILIGGMPRCGKSSLVDFLMKEYNIPYYSTDILCQLINASFPESGIDVELPIEEKIKTFQPILQMLVKTLSFQKGTIAIEGDVITPGFAKEMEAMYNTKSCFLGSTNATFENYKIRTGGGYDWISERSDREVSETVEYVRKYSQQYKKECKELGLLYYELEIGNFEKGLRELSEYLLKQ
ncbi:MAG: hypothetical protein ACK4NC_06420 [Candidatus Gracilibacteria bacterium]